MGRTKKAGVSASFQSRYGTKARKRYTGIIREMRRKHECPSCHEHAVKRLSFGIWICRRCGYKFSGGAYTPTTKLGIVAARASGRAVAAKTAVPTKDEGMVEPSPEEMEPKVEIEGNEVNAEIGEG